MKTVFSLSALIALTLVTLPASAQGQDAPYGYAPQGAPPPGAGLGAPAPQSFGGYPQVQPQMGGAPAPGYYDATYANGAPGAGFAPMTATPGAAVGFAPSSMLTYGMLEGFYNYTQWKSEGVDDAHGMGLSLTAELFDPFFIHGAFTWGTGNGAALPSTYNMSTVSLGGGGHFALTDRFHIMGEIGGIYASLSADRTNVNFTDGAIYVSPAFRFAATESLELKAGITATSADKYDSKVFDLSAYYKLFSQMDIGLGMRRGDETRSYQAGVRFRW